MAKHIQGQGDSTGLKQESVKAIIKSLQWPLSVIQERKKMPVFWIETNAGSGWNEQEKIAGSPIIARQAANDSGLNITGIYCDIDAFKINQLRNAIGDSKSYFYPCDNSDFVLGLPEIIKSASSDQSSHNPYGIIYVDPNGCKTGFPISQIQEITQKLPRLDIVINYPANSAKRCRSVFKSDEKYPTVESIVERIGKTHGAVRLPASGWQFTMLILTNYDGFKISKEMKKLQFRDIASEEGKRIMKHADLNRKEYSEFVNETGLLF